ncbi:diguanylate cyclase (GGDEF)-like protein [Litorivivens lipolytica]|uniref:Diguanylate cyclase (GGDEF)-like protein n=1 Tax=Litorivivens lipolytica TaxID=1524264 RepID=A0A7W4W3C1_9GAMM|nr:diguanylate cyclase [Litorivivens lipolytica]MBB3046687.1 diguanylate cyclase (GGDEF)-like protein [Litorivivens lipolytica]
MQTLNSERDAYRNCLDRMLRATTQGTRIHGLKVLDVDRFRLINQVAGFNAGDEFLGHLHKTLSASLLEGDRLFYLGEDSFAMLCPYRGLKELYAESEQLLDELGGRQVTLGGICLDVHFSIGVAQTEETDQSWEAATLRAERGLFKAKSDGGSCVRAELTQDGEPHQAPAQTPWVECIHHAFLHDGFSLVYSELVDSDFVLTDILLKSGGESVPIADLRVELGSMDLLLAMDRWVLTKLSESSTLANKTLVRLSRASVCAQQFMRFLQRLLTAHPELADKLWFAVSERELADVRPQLQQFLEALKGLGCHAVLLDAGTTADSLGHLSELSVSTVTPFPQALNYQPDLREAVIQAMEGVAGAVGKDFIGTPFSL